MRTIQNDNLQNLLFNHFGTNFVIWLSYHNLAKKSELSLEAKITVNAFSSVQRGKLNNKPDGVSAVTTNNDSQFEITLI